MQPAPIVDASVAVALFVESGRSAIAERHFAAGAALAAPDILIAEAANALWTYVRASGRGGETAAEFLERLGERVDLAPAHALAKDALAIAIELDHPVYDAFYLALARREGSHVVTFDERLLRKLAGTRYAHLAVRAGAQPNER
jgi:predicted nucleic acid-binding protein